MNTITKTASNTRHYISWKPRIQPRSRNASVLNKVNTIIKTAWNTTHYKLKVRNIAPFVQSGHPKQSEHNHQNSIKYKTVQSESQEYITFSAMRLSYKSGHNHKNGIQYMPLLSWKPGLQLLSCNKAILNKVNTITKTASNTRHNKLKAKKTAPFVQWCYPKQSEHNHQKRHQIQDTI